MDFIHKVRNLLKETQWEHLLKQVEASVSEYYTVITSIILLECYVAKSTAKTERLEQIVACLQQLTEVEDHLSGLLATQFRLMPHPSHNRKSEIFEAKVDYCFKAYRTIKDLRQTCLKEIRARNDREIRLLIAAGIIDGSKVVWDSDRDVNEFVPNISRVTELHLGSDNKSQRGFRIPISRDELGWIFFYSNGSFNERFNGKSFMDADILTEDNLYQEGYELSP